MTTNAKIGLEVHAPLNPQTKLYCPCPSPHENPQAPPNTLICPTCTGQPGARPQGINKNALTKAIQTTKLLNLTPQNHATVQRKHYTYPDLPNNYQRTTTPLGQNGHFWNVRIHEAHIEEDPGAYDPHNDTIDLNRSGQPLVEIVTQPDLETPQDIATWLDILHLALTRANLIHPNAQLKTDVNVSTHGNDRVEIKNVTGGRNATKAAQHEIQRQHTLHQQGTTPTRETRHYDETTGTTRKGREKETIGDYRYMLDPDLPTLNIPPLTQETPPPQDATQRLHQLLDEHHHELGEAIALLQDPQLETLYDEIQNATDHNHATEVTLRRLRSELDYRDTTLTQHDIPTQPIKDLAQAWHDDAITKHVFTRLLRAHLDGENIQPQLEQETNTTLNLEPIIQEVLNENPDPIQDYREGKQEALNYLVGQVMQRTQGRADPKTTREGLKDALKQRS